MKNSESTQLKREREPVTAAATVLAPVSASASVAASVSMPAAAATMPALTPPTMEKRERIQIQRQQGDRNRVQESNGLSAVTVWYDTRLITGNDPTAVITRIGNLRYSGVVLYPETMEQFLPQLPPRLHRILYVTDAQELADFSTNAAAGTGKDWVIASADLKVLAEARNLGLQTCFRAYVDDGASLHESIAMGHGNKFLMIRFRDPTNIPLELVIASLQATHTVLIKEINSPDDVDDAIVTLGVMEVGADGVLFSPTDHGVLDQFISRLESVVTPRVEIQVATVVQSVPIGMGIRSCLDLTTLFAPTEGMLIGSTSQGGILACPEVFFLPYMELRPFRVNAGAVHSYVYNTENRTDYMTELRVGSKVMIVGADGKTRQASMGRVKTEVRPLRLIEVEFAGGERVNVIMQDDWHVRIFSDKAQPLNITQLKPGDKVLGHIAQPGRHVGIKVDENIIES